jgi:hypothetical protein
VDPPPAAGPAPGPRPAGREGVGLRNTRDRLELLYGSHHAFSFRGAPGLGCQVALSIPLAYSRREAPTPARPLATPPTTAGPPLAVTP